MVICPAKPRWMTCVSLDPKFDLSMPWMHFIIYTKFLNTLEDLGKVTGTSMPQIPPKAVSLHRKIVNLQLLVNIHTQHEHSTLPQSLHLCCLKHARQHEFHQSEEPHSEDSWRKYTQQYITVVGNFVEIFSKPNLFMCRNIHSASKVLRP